MKKILVLNSKLTDLARKHMDEVLAKRKDDIQLDLKYLQDITCLINPHNQKVEFYINNEPINSYDMVFLRTWKSQEPTAIAIAHYLKKNNIPFVDQEPSTATHGDKLVEHVILQQNGINVPKTFFGFRRTLVKDIDLIEKNIGFPCVIKSAHGRLGMDNYLVQNKKEAKAILKKDSKVSKWLVQEVISFDFDYRFYVLNYTTRAAHKRMKDPASKSHVTNVSQGGTVEFVKLQDVKELCTIAEKAARLFNRGVCGVDVVTDKNTGKHYIFEANRAPGLKVPQLRQELADFLAEDYIDE